MNLEEMAREIRGNVKTHKETDIGVSKEIYQQMGEENLRLKKEIVVLEREV